jgi:hypothetical protein
MKKLLIALAAVLLAGCDYTVPLVTTPGIEIDKSVLGLWEATENDGKTEQLAVLPLDKNEYLVSYPNAAKDGLFARACLCRTDDKTLVQLKWVGGADGKAPDDNRVYQFLSYSVSGDKLTVRMLNTDVVKGDVASTKDLAKAIADNRNNPKLFNEATVFTKVTK